MRADGEEGKGYAQLVAHKGKGCDEANAKDETHDLRNEGVEASHDEQSAKYRGANVARR